MSIGRAVARACREVAIRRRTSLVTPSIACMFSTSVPKKVKPEHAPATSTALGNSPSTLISNNSNVRNSSQGVELEELNENEDDPIMRMKFKTLNENILNLQDKKFLQLWKRIEQRPTKALQILHTWIAHGNELSKEAAIEICLKLCYIRRQIRALEIINWIIEDNAYTLTPRDYALQIRLMCRYGSPIKAERLYGKVPAEMKTEDVAAALITSLSRSDVMCKAEMWYNSLKVKTAPIFNMMMILFLRRNRHQEVLDLLEDFRNSGNAPNPLTYLILLKYKERIGGLQGIEQEAETAMKKIDIKNKDMKDAVLADMMTHTKVHNAHDLYQMVYAYLGNLDKVETIWSMLKNETWTLAGRFVSAINSFGILGKVSRAESVLNDVLKTKKKAIQKPYCAMIGVYAKHGMMDKAEKAMQALRKELSFPWFGPYNHLVMGYLTKDEPDKAYDKLQEGWNYVRAEKRIVPDYDLVVGMMPVFAKKKDVAGAEKLMGLFGNYGDARLYNELLKVYIEAKVSPGSFLNRMKARNVEPNDETRRLLEVDAA